MKKNLLLLTLLLAFIIETALTFLCFFKPATALALFGMLYNEQTVFLGYIIAWFCLLVSIIIMYAMWHLKNNKDGYSPIIYILGFWWIGLGIGVYIAFNKTGNLLIDSLKGVVLVMLNYLYGKENQKNDL